MRSNLGRMEVAGLHLYLELVRSDGKQSRANHTYRLRICLQRGRQTKSNSGFGLGVLLALLLHAWDVEM